MASLASLLVDLSVNTAALRKGLEDAKGLLQGFGKSVQNVGKDLHELAEMKGVEFGKEIIEGLAEFVLKGNEAIVTLARTAAAAKVPVDEFSKLNYVAKLSGLSTEDLGGSLNKLNKSLGMAAAGSKEQAALFHALGVSVVDATGKVRPTQEVFLELAKVFDGFADDSAKSTLEMDVFGKSGAQLETMLKELKDGLGEAGDEAERFGLVVTPAAAASAKQFEDATIRLNFAFQAVSQRVAAELAPALTTLTGNLTNTRDGAKILDGVVQTLATTIRILASGAVIVGTVFEALGKTVGLVAAAVVAALSGDFKGALNILGDFNVEMLSAVKDGANAMKVVWDAGSKGALDYNANLQPMLKSSTGVLKHFQALKDGVGAAEGMKSLIKVIEDYGKKVAEITGGGKDPLAEITYRLDKGDLAKDLAAVGAEAARMRKEILDAAAALQKLQVGNLKIQLNFEDKLASNKLDVDVGQRQQAFNNINAPAGKVFAQQTKGFDDFGAALKAYSDAIREKAQWVAQAKVAEMKGDTAAAEGALLFAQDAEFAADKANIAASAFEAAAAKSSTLVEGLKVLGSSFTSKLGQLGTVINDAIQGFQQGGIWGALAALVMDLLSMMDGWKQIQNIAQGSLMIALREMSTGLNSIIGGLRPLMGAIEGIAHALHGVLNPILEVIGRVLGAIAPIFESIGITLQVLNPIIDMVCQIIGGILVPILKLLSPILMLVAQSFLGTELGIQYVKLAFEMLVDWVDGLFGSNNKGGVQQAWIDIVTTEAQMIDLWNHGLDGLANSAADNAEAMGASADQTNKNTAAAAKFNQQLTNLPNGFKYYEDRFNAMNPVGAGSGWAPGSTGSGGGGSNPGGTPTGTDPGAYASGFLGFNGGGFGGSVHVHIAGSVVVEKDLIASIKKALDVGHFQAHGVPRP